MPTPTGEWEVGPSDSKVTAIHAALLHNGKVLIFHCRSYPMWSRLYDPEENEMNEINLEVPIWPVATELRPIEPSRIFCAGHCFLPDGKLLVAGGEKDFPYPYEYIAPNMQPVRGLDYCFIFDLDSNPPWSVPINGSTDLPIHMDKGRWYPSLTVLNDGRILAMGGISSELDPYNISQLNKVPEVFVNTSSNWGFFTSSTENPEMPGDIDYFYPAGHLIPVGSLAGKVFFTTTQLIPIINPDPPPYLTYTEVEGSTQTFDPAAAVHDPYWENVGGQRPSPSQYSNHILLPIRLKRGLL